MRFQFTSERTQEICYEFSVVHFGGLEVRFFFFSIFLPPLIYVVYSVSLNPLKMWWRFGYALGSEIGDYLRAVQNDTVL
jgi:hypothetical protein